jgi:hypothetical protein
MNEPLVTMEVTLTRLIDQNGRMAVKIRTPAKYNTVEILGLLEVAKAYIFSEMRTHD